MMIIVVILLNRSCSIRDQVGVTIGQYPQVITQGSSIDVLIHCHNRQDYMVRLNLNSTNSMMHQDLAQYTSQVSKNVNKLYNVGHQHLNKTAIMVVRNTSHHYPSQILHY